jgi:hypothetical protein
MTNLRGRETDAGSVVHGFAHPFNELLYFTAPDFGRG